MMMNLLNKLFVWFANRFAKNKEQGRLIYPVTEGDQVYNLVQDKMNGFEAEVITKRIQSLEKVIGQLTHQILILTQENKLQRELLLYTSTNIEELMNYIDNPPFEEEEQEIIHQPVSLNKKLNIN